MSGGGVGGASAAPPAPQLVRAEGLEAPVLARGRHDVGRRADAHAGDEEPLIAPGVVAVRVAADGQGEVEAAGALTPRPGAPLRAEALDCGAEAGIVAHGRAGVEKALQRLAAARRGEEDARLPFEDRALQGHGLAVVDERRLAQALGP